MEFEAFRVLKELNELVMSWGGDGQREQIKSFAYLEVI